MGQYGRAAVKAVKFMNQGKYKSPETAWHKAICSETNKVRSRKKGCPKGAFLGLCEAGEIKGVPSGNYCNSIDNKRYALNAVKLLKKHQNLSKNKSKLWDKVMSLENTYHSENEQMDVVVSLWDNNLIL